MKIIPLRLLAIAASALAFAPVTPAQTLVVTVNSAGNDTVPNASLTLVEAVSYLNDELAQLVGNDAVHGLGRPLSVGESNLVTEEDSDTHGGVIRFQVPGDGPHVIAAPPGGFPKLFAPHTVIDGFSQPGARPNSNAITNANNAVLKVVLDARSLTPHPVSGEQPDYSLQIRAHDVVVRGFSVLAGTDLDTFGIYFSEGASGGSVSGCWFGISPDQATLSGGEVAIAAYGSEGGHAFGTNGDGVEDRAEFNVIVAHAIGVQFEDTRDIRVSGNFIGVLPDGKTLPPEAIRETLEGDAVEGAGLSGTLWIGTNADGVADADEANVIGGMNDDVLELYGDAESVVIAGNWIGVAADGTNPLPFNKLMRVQKGRFTVGAPVTETMFTAGKGNVIANGSAVLIRHREGTYVSLRGNRLFGNTGDPLHDPLAQSFHALLLGRETDLAPTLDATASSMAFTGSLALSGPGTNGLMPALVDVYLADPATVGTSPQGLQHIATFMDNGMMDSDPAVGRFRYSLMSVSVPSEGMHAVVVAATIRNNDGFETSVFSNPVTVHLAGPSAQHDMFNNVPMQGSMVHVILRHNVVAGLPTLGVHLDPSTPTLTPLPVSHPGASFDPAHPWYADLDPSRGGYAFNRQYGFLLDGESDPLAEGHGIHIRQLATSPGLLSRLYRQNPATWKPMFGQAGSSESFEWNLLMFHPAYALPPGVVGPVEADYEAFVVDASGQAVGTGIPFKLLWNVARGITLQGPRLTAGQVEIDAVLSMSWAGYRLRLERRTALGSGMWMEAAILKNASAGTNRLRDSSPPAGGAFYRVLANQP